MPIEDLARDLMDLWENVGGRFEEARIIRLSFKEGALAICLAEGK